MSTNEGGVPRGKDGASAEGKTRPRRLVLLAGDEGSAVERVLAEYPGAEGRGKVVHADIEKVAVRHPGRCVAAEWLGPLGWTRFLSCRKPE
jgi:hypothetical protein